MRNPIRYLYIGTGLVFTGLGIIGAFVPLVPTTIFLIIAAYFFSKSCPYLENWLLYHPRFGEPLRNWQETKSISKKHKTLAVSVLWISLTLSAIIVNQLHVTIILAITGITLSVFLLTRRTPKPQTNSEEVKLSA